MAPKRTNRNVKVLATNIYNINYDKLSLSDVMCPICRTVLIEPVTLPCNHGFCLSCFNNSMENTNLVCPLCRLRISSWLRLSKKDKLVNQKLWDAIQTRFSQRVSDKLQGNEDDEEEAVQRQITSAGEIRLEYEMEKAKVLETQQKQHEAELKASEEYIQKLQEQEQHAACLEEENLRLSEQLAKKLNKEFNIDPGPSSSKLNVAPPLSDKKQTQLDRFLTNTHSRVVPKEYTCKVLNQSVSDASITGKNLVKFMENHVKRKFGKIVEDTSDSNDSITSECRYFKPIDRKAVPVAFKVSVVKVPAIMAKAHTVIIGAPKGNKNFSHSVSLSAFAVTRNTFLTSTVLGTPETEIETHKVEHQNVGESLNTSVSKVSINKNLPLFNGNNNHLNSQHLQPIVSASKSHTTVSDINKIDKHIQLTPKRKRSISRPSVEENTPTKRKIVQDTISPVISNKPIENFNCNLNKSLSNRHQEENDFKLAMKLHKELNNSNRYPPTKNNITLHIRNTRKSTRQPTLKEIISQAAST